MIDEQVAQAVLAEDNGFFVSATKESEEVEVMAMIDRLASHTNHATGMSTSTSTSSMSTSTSMSMSMRTSASTSTSTSMSMSMSKSTNMSANTNTRQENLLAHAFYLMNRVTRAQMKDENGKQVSAMMIAKVTSVDCCVLCCEARHAYVCVCVYA